MQHLPFLKRHKEQKNSFHFFLFEVYLIEIVLSISDKSNGKSTFLSMLGNLSGEKEYILLGYRRA